MQEWRKMKYVWTRHKMTSEIDNDYREDMYNRAIGMFPCHIPLPQSLCPNSSVSSKQQITIFMNIQYNETKVQLKTQEYFKTYPVLQHYGKGSWNPMMLDGLFLLSLDMKHVRWYGAVYIWCRTRNVLVTIDILKSDRNKYNRCITYKSHLLKL